MPVQTPICDFGKKALPFELKSTENKVISLNDIKGENGTLIMFICNHCPYVKVITKEILEDCNELKKIGINIQLQYVQMILLIIQKTHSKI